LSLRRLKDENGSEVFIEGELVRRKKLAKEMSRCSYLKFAATPTFAEYSKILNRNGHQAALDFLHLGLSKNVEIRSPEPSVLPGINPSTMQDVDHEAATTSAGTPLERQPSPFLQQISGVDIELASEVGTPLTTQDHIPEPGVYTPESPLDQHTQDEEIDWRENPQSLESVLARTREYYSNQIPFFNSSIANYQLALKEQQQEVDLLQHSLEQQQVSLEKLRQFLNESGLPCVGEARNLGFTCSQLDCYETFWSRIARVFHEGRVHNTILIPAPGLQAPHSDADSNVGTIGYGKEGCGWKGNTRSEYEKHCWNRHDLLNVEVDPKYDRVDRCFAPGCSLSVRYWYYRDNFAVI
jgi:hypothetical protein